MTFLEIQEEIRQGKNLDVHILSESKHVRKLVAQHGYKLDVLVNDRSDEVRAAVARKGYGLKQLRNDKSDWVRLAVLETQASRKMLNAGYEITNRLDMGSSHFVMGYNPKAPAPYVTWRYFPEQDSFSQGRYFTDENSAMIDMLRRGGETLDLGDESLGLQLLTDTDRSVLQARFREEAERDAVRYALEDLLEPGVYPCSFESLIGDPVFMARAIHLYNNIDHSAENEAFAESLESLIEELYPQKENLMRMPEGNFRAEARVFPEMAQLLNALLQHPSAQIPDIFGPYGDNLEFTFHSDSGLKASLELTPSYDPIDPQKLSATEPPHVIARVWNENDELITEQTFSAKELNRRATGEYRIELSGSTSIALFLEEDESLRRTGNQFFYKAHPSSDGHYFRHDGEPCTIRRALTQKECDILASGFMWEAEFPDGDVLHVFDSELRNPSPVIRKPSLDAQLKDAGNRLLAQDIPGGKLPDKTR